VKVETGGKTLPNTFSFNAGMVVITLQRSAVVLAGQTLLVRLG
jgi:hypothetical protein